MKLQIKPLMLAAAVSMALGTPAANAAEQPIGEPVEVNGMEIAAVYLQAVKMEPMMPGMMEPTDIHLEADIHALKGNANGFGEGEWMPYLGITYRLEKQGSNWSTAGQFHPMVAADGPHYGANIKLDGPGKYHLTYYIKPPAYKGFYRHFDKETGVGEWWKPFTVEWDFTYVGTGKKGGY
ncbi:MAG: iron transporter [Gammaproteobacteria bacterium]